MTTAADPSLQAFLREVFACSAEVAADIGAKARARRYSPQAVILSQGSAPDETHLVITGLAHARTYGTEGQIVLLHAYGAGDIFGAVAGAAGPDAEVVAVEDLAAAVFAAMEFLTLFERHACVGVAVSRMLMRQLRQSAGRLVERATLSAHGRVYAELLRLAREGDGRTISPAPMISRLAERMNTTRETASRAISALERRGLVRREGGDLMIVAPHRLEELVV